MARHLQSRCGGMAAPIAPGLFVWLCLPVCWQDPAQPQALGSFWSFVFVITSCSVFVSVGRSVSRYLTHLSVLYLSLPSLSLFPSLSFSFFLPPPPSLSLSLCLPPPPLSLCRSPFLICLSPVSLSSCLSLVLCLSVSLVAQIMSVGS